MLGFNSRAKNVCIKGIEEVDIDFNSRFDAKKKTYVYTLNDNEYVSAITKNREYFVGKELDVERMKKAAKYLIGEHDFKSFKSSGENKKTTVRTIYDISIERKNVDIYGKYSEENIGKNENRIIIQITGNGFLYNMVRIIVGTLLEIGLRKKKTRGNERSVRSKR
jgi:tRNA pseudouridine synthase A 3